MLYAEQSSLIALLLAVSMATAEIRPLGETVEMLMSGKRAEMGPNLGHIPFFFFFYFMQLEDQA